MYQEKVLDGQYCSQMDIHDKYSVQKQGSIIATIILCYWYENNDSVMQLFSPVRKFSGVGNVIHK